MIGGVDRLRSWRKMNHVLEVQSLSSCAHERFDEFIFWGGSISCMPDPSIHDSQNPEHTLLLVILDGITRLGDL